MISDVNIVESTGMKCKDMAMATAARALNRDFELMFVSSWNFDYSNIKGETIGGSIFIPNGEFVTDLNKYHGVDTLVYSNIYSDKCLEFVLLNLDNGMPIDMNYDQAYLPWAKEIRKKAPLRYSGNIMILGHEENVLNCIDIHGTHNKEKLLFEKFVEYSQTINSMDFMVFNKLDENLEFDLREHVSTTLERNFGKNGMFEKMRQYALVIKDNFDFGKEIETTLKRQGQITTPTWIDFVQDIINVGRMRALYSISLSYIADKYKNEELRKLCNEFKIIWSEWQLIVSILVKAYLSNNFNRLNIRLSKKILEIIDSERKATTTLEKSIQGKRNYVQNIKKNIKDMDLKALNYLEIEKYFNNKAFSQNDEMANFDGLNNSYLFNLLKNPYVEIEQKKLFSLKDNGLDNIKCLGQVLSITPILVDKILILGSCDSGAFFGEFSVYFENGDVQKNVVGFGEWRFEKCELGEELALVTDRYYLGEVSEQEKGYIFYNTIDIYNSHPVTKIQLPYCENMHIFAITLLL